MTVLRLPILPLGHQRSRPRTSLARVLSRAAAAATLGAALASSTAAAADRPPPFGGLWQLDLKESETLRQKVEGMRGAEGGPGFRGGGGWRGGIGGGPPMGGTGPRHGGFGGDRPEGGERGGGRDSAGGHEMRELARPPMSLLIEPGDSTFVLSERGRTLEVLVLGDATLAGASIQPDAPHVQARWKGKRLVAERVGARGGRFTEEFGLEDGGKTLTVRTTVEGRGGRAPLELRRVYHRSEGEEPAPPPGTSPAPAAVAPDSSRP